jgi:CMP-N-acetylneuraminic acid synthetase
MKILVIIPARSGSVGIKDKNIQSIGGKTLLEHAVYSGLKITHPENIIISSDSESYLSIVEKIDARIVKSKRPAHLSTSGASIIDTIDHELRNHPHINSFDYAVLLEPSHFGRRENIENLGKLLKEGDYDFGLGVYPVPLKYHMDKQISVSSGYNFKNANIVAKNRQALDVTYIRSGEFYAFKPKLFLNNLSFFVGRGRIFLTANDSINIDDQSDLYSARKIQGEL